MLQLGYTQVPRLDTVFFGQESRETFEADGKAYEVIGGSAKEAKAALPKMLKARHHAKVNKDSALKHPDNNRFFGAVMEFDNGMEVVTSNFILLRQRTRCDVDIALSQGITQWIERNKQTNQQTPLPKVKALYLANADPEGLSPSPCEYCLEWFNTSMFDANTPIYFLEKGDHLIRKRALKELLPLHKRPMEHISRFTDLPVSELPLSISASAQAALQKEKPLSESKLRKLLSEAKRAYEWSQKSGIGYTPLRAGSAVIVSPFQRIVSSSRFEWARRFINYPDLSAGMEAIHITTKLQLRLKQMVRHTWIPEPIRKSAEKLLVPPTIQAVAYYGNDTNTPSLGSLGKIRRHRGSENTLVITVENDTIQVRTMQDYLPEIYTTPPLTQH